MALGSEGPTILVVDDEPKVARLIARTFAPEGFEVLHAHDGEVGVEMVESERPDLVLLDVTMPRMDGMVACRRIRELSDVPIIMLTSRSMEQDQLAAFGLGADDYVIKPFSPIGLLARVHAVLRRARKPEPTAEAVFDDGVLRIDRARREVTLRGEPVVLSRIESRLLDVLAANPGRVFLHEELQNRVWGEEYGASSEQLRTSIRYLRRKIEPDPSTPRYVLNRPGIGYVFRAPDASRAPMV
jgi:DNA-binding response OmpR family regulator